MRDLIVFAIVMLGLPMAFRRPYAGLLLFSWLAYMRPQDLCWGFARSMRFSLFVAMAMLVGYFVHEAGRRRFTIWDVRTRAMTVLAILVSVSFATAQVQTEYEVQYFIEFIKIVVIALFTAGQVNSLERFRWMVCTIAICLGFYGFKGGLFGLLSGGAPILRGPGGMLEDNNDFALALVMNVPLLYYLGFTERRRWVRRLALAAVGLTVIAVLLTHSRGAFLALTATALWIAWRSGKLLRAGMSLAVLGVLFVAFAPDSVMDRLATIKEGGQESSAAARIRSWTVAFRMIIDNPALGVGLRNFQPRYKEYARELLSESQTTYVAHNSYLQIWAESGTPAFLIYMVLLFSVLVSCRRVYKWAKARAVPWGMDYARMLEATTVGFMIGATFLNRGHFDLIYHWFALVTSFVFVARESILYGRGPQPAAVGPRGITVRPRAARPSSGEGVSGTRESGPRRSGAGIGVGRRWGPLATPQFRSASRFAPWQRN